MTSVQVLENALRKEREWLEKQPICKPRSERKINRAEDAVVAALDLMGYAEAQKSHQPKLGKWIAHKPHRKPLAGPQPEVCVWTSSGRKACLELLRLAESEMAAIAQFLPQLPAGVLRIPKSREMSDRQLANLEKGRDALASKRGKHAERGKARVA